MTNETKKLVDVDVNGVLGNVDLQNASNVEIIKTALEKSAEWQGMNKEERDAFMQNPKASLQEIAHKTGMAAVYANSTLQELRAELASQEHPDKEGFDAMLEVAIALNETFPFGVEITGDALSTTASTPEINVKASSHERK